GCYAKTWFVESRWAQFLTCTVTRCTELFEYPPAFQGGSIGWVRPVASAAREHTTYVRGPAGVQSSDHRCQAWGEAASSSLASVQVSPPSTLTSTRTMGPHPDQARPSSRHCPVPPYRSRARNSGNPGGSTSERGAIRFTGSPTSSSTWRYL